MNANIEKAGGIEEHADVSGQDTRQYSTFFVGDLFFGVEVLRVQEVLRYHEMTQVPLAPEVVEGLINLRGQIVAAIDMRRRLKLTPRAAGRMPLNMVVRSEEGVVSLLVDEIGDVLEVKSDTFEVPPDNVSGVVRELVHGVHKLKGRLLLILDTEKTIDLSVAEASPA